MHSNYGIPEIPTTYGVDPLVKPIYNYTKDIQRLTTYFYHLRLTDLSVTFRVSHIYKAYRRSQMTRILSNLAFGTPYFTTFV